jgi:hypothetical protein
MQKTAFVSNAVRAPAGITRRSARASVKVMASSRVDQFSKDDVIVGYENE